VSRSSTRTSSTAGRSPRATARRGALRRLALLATAPLVLAGCSLGGDRGGDAPVTGDGPTPEETAAAAPVDPTVTAPPQEDLATYYGQEVTWVGCETIDPPEGVTGQAHECTTVQVPLDYAAPGKGSLLLSLTRLPATGDRLGSLLLNPAGRADRAWTTPSRRAW
jgi:hypothetical protein